MSMEAVLTAIDAEIGKLQKARALLSGGGETTLVTESAVSGPKVSRQRSRLSPSARRRIAEAQKMRWAKAKAAKSPAKPAAQKVAEEVPAAKAAKKVSKRRRELSGEARKRIAQGQRKRWKLVKAAKLAAAEAPAKLAPAVKGRAPKPAPAQASKKAFKKAPARAAASKLPAVKVKKAAIPKKAVPAPAEAGPAVVSAVTSA